MVCWRLHFGYDSLCVQRAQVNDIGLEGNVRTMPQHSATKAAAVAAVAYIHTESIYVLLGGEGVLQKSYETSCVFTEVGISC